MGSGVGCPIYADHELGCPDTAQDRKRIPSKAWQTKLREWPKLVATRAEFHLVSKQWPVRGYFVRNMLLIGTGAFSAVFVFEMLIGRYIAQGAGPENAIEFLETFASPLMLGIIFPIGAIAFFGGVWLMAIPFIRSEPHYRWPAALLAVGATLILAEILSAMVILSQTGNFAILLGSIGFARQILSKTRRPDAA